MIEPHPHDVELLDYVEDELAKDRRRAVGAHVESCQTCRATVADLEGARAALRAAPELELPVDRRARIDAALGRAAPERRVRGSRRRLLGVLAVAAAFAAVLVGVVSVTGGRDDPPAGGEAAAPQAQESDELAGGGKAEDDTAGAGAGEFKESPSEGSRGAGPLSAEGSIASVQGPAADVAALLGAHGLDARVEDGRVVVRRAQPRAVVRALEGRPRGPVAVDVE